ncbi:glycosyltransferase [Bizionia arctica]|uniref:Glycosyl transferase n=1 Tax=Bizionia arctica TaxID=1495645 RepID=A0A917GS29_9FLAO|nr:glycosyltransferase [Bizionia arctica]GGG54753.1 glycosyl transferase [Bizionia arctica]
MQSNNKKICIVASSLGKGGAERSAAQLSFMLHHLNYDVHIVTVLNHIEFEYKGTLLNLGALKDKNDTFFGRLQRLKYFKAYLKSHNFDVIIDGRARVQWYRELLISKWVYAGISVVYVVHCYKISKAFTPYKALNKFLYKKAQMVSVSQAAKNHFKESLQLKHVETIYNAFDFEILQKKAEVIKFEDLDLKNYILFFGRIHDEPKNLKLLLEAYKLSKLPAKNIPLLIIGEGPDLQEIKGYVSKLELDNHVVFKGFMLNPYPYVKHAKFALLTSRHEGFPMVIPETLGLGTPMISVDCKSGPNEVIKSGYNGLLVENFNAHAISDAMNSFIFDETLYQTCKLNAQESVQRFSTKNITNDWKQLLDKIRHQE